MLQTMGQTIKKLRKERNFTQEELAEQLNITPQAVSRWENETSMPDISQIVPIASVFGVSIEVLFGVFGTDHYEEINRIIDEAEEPLKSDGSFASQEKCYYALLEALKRYPSNIGLLKSTLGHGCNIAMDYRCKNDSRTDETFRECVREAEMIINYSKDVSAIMSAHMWLVRLYCSFGKFDQAKEHAMQFPSACDYNSGAQLAWIYRAEGKTDEEIKQRCTNVALILEAFEGEIIPLGNAYKSKEQYDDALFVYRSPLKIVPAIYGNEKGVEKYIPPFHCLHYINAFAALCCVRLGRIDEAMDILEENYKYVLAQGDAYNIQTKLDTPILREHEFKYFTGSIRENPRFQALLVKINALPD